MSDPAADAVTDAAVDAALHVPGELLAACGGRKLGRGR